MLGAHASNPNSCEAEVMAWAKSETLPQVEKSGGGQGTNVCILEPFLRSFALW